METIREFIERELNDEQTMKVLQTYHFAKDIIDKAREDGTLMGAHLLDHGLRVAGYATLIAEGEGENPFLPIITSLLLDIGRSTDDERSKSWKHGYVSGELAEDFLNELGLNNEEALLVQDALRDHSRLNKFVERKSPLVKIVMDADRLATIGPLGPMRAAATRWSLPLVLPEGGDERSGDDEIVSVLQDVEYRQGEWLGMIWTPTGKKMAEEKNEWHIKYVQDVKDDVKVAYDACNAIGLPLDLS